MSTTPATPTMGSNTVPFGINQELHDKAVNLLLKLKADTKVLAAKGVIKDYNTRRKDATAELQVVLTQIWQKFDQGETVGTYTGKKDCCNGVGLGYRWAAKVIAGRPEVNSVHLPKVGGILTLFGKRYRVMSLPESEDEIHPFGNELENKFGASCQITIGLHLIGEVPKPERKKIETVPEVGKTYFVRHGSRNELIETIYDGQDGDRHVFIPNGKTTGHRVLAKNAPKVWELDEQGKLKAVKIPNKLVLVRKVTQ
jgi:hypothetical protein